MLKRITEMLFCILTAPVSLLVCLFIGIIYFIFERDSPVFRQVRVGRYEKEFTILKMRTMAKSTVERGTHELDSASVTRIGGILRATKMDEIPQLWNVLIGQMSLVGPRPCLLGQKQLIIERRKLDVFSVRPGITGQSQLDGIDMSDPKALAKSDAKYISNSGLLVDLRILVLTVFGQGSGDKISRS